MWQHGENVKMYQKSGFIFAQITKRLLQKRLQEKLKTVRIDFRTKQVVSMANTARITMGYFSLFIP